MRFLCVLLALLALVTFDFSPAVATCHTSKGKCNKTTATDANEIIYDLTIPWPFRHHKSDSDGDGVSDDADRCPGTPRGATVDTDGCPLDSDGDGVFDGLDKCPGTPRGATVDNKGCPQDSDGDGVFDGLDKCPDTPRGATVDTDGCPLDSDGDGVFDGLDKCPDTPRGATVDNKGCPKDSDGDGVFDGIDRCPNTPTNVKVDETGCPIERTELETEFLDSGVIRASNILFETNKAELKPESHEVLNEIGDILSHWPELKIEISGHTDSRGAEEYNQTLSEKRANAVFVYLTRHFSTIDAGKLKTAGYGETKPVASNDTVEGRAKNRRVDFTVLNTEVLKKIIKKRKLDKK